MRKTVRLGVVAAAALIAVVAGLQIAGAGATGGAGNTRSGPVYSSEEAIRFVQEILVADGLLETGSFASGHRDSATIEALRTFQRTHYLRASGQIDPETMGVLTSHPHKGRMPMAAKEEEPVKVAEKAPAPPAPAPEPVAKEETVELTTAAVEQQAPAREMPKTGSPTVLLLALGGLLVGTGALLLIRPRG